MTNDKPLSRILWRQVWGLAGLLTAVLVSLQAYGFYQPRILTSLGFAELAGSLIVVQGILGAILEPILGRLSDRILQHCGNRLPQITIGVTVAGLLFVAIALLLQNPLSTPWRWLIPVLMTAWLMATIAFRGPVVALLRQFAPTEELPLANAMLIFLFGLIAAIAPLLNLLLSHIETSVAFVGGAILLTLGAFCLYRTAPLSAPIPIPAAHPIPNLGRIGAIVFGVGLSSGLELNVLFSIVPPIVSDRFFSINPAWMTSAMMFICALSANVWDKQVLRWGAIRALKIGLGSIVFLFGLMPLCHTPWLSLGLTLLLGIALGLVFIATIPYALAAMPPDQAGLSTGLYFGGSGAASTLGTWLVQSGNLTPVMGFMVIMISFAIAVLGLNATSKSI